MRRKKSRDTIRVHNEFKNSKHSIPRCMLEVLCGLREMEFIHHIGVGKFFPCMYKTEGKVVGFSDSGNTYILNVVYRGYEQKLFLKVDCKKEEYEKRLNEFLTKL